MLNGFLGKLGRIFFEDHQAAGVLSTGNYRPDVDGLRSIAILAVLAFHIVESPFVSGGFIGVDLFFVISGYLITGIIFSNLEKNKFTFGGFYARRIRRIFPAALLVLGSCLTAGWLLLLGAEYAPLGKHTAAGAAFVSNLVLWGESGYFDTAASQKVLLHLWSLGIEEQFYIVLPIVMLVAWRLKLRISILFILLFVASFASCVHTISYDRVAAFYAPYNRGWELMAGSLLCLFTRRLVFSPDAEGRWGLWPVVRTLFRIAEGPVAVGFVLWPVLDYYSKTPFPGWSALPPVLAGCLFIHAGTRLREGASWKESFWAGTLVNRLLLCNRPMIWIGLISYPLYLWHWPLWYFGKMVFPTPTPLLRATVLAVSFLLAALTYFLIERPVRHQWANGRTVAICSVLMALVAGFGLWVWRSDGVPSRCPAEYATMWDTYGKRYGELPQNWVARPDKLVQSAPGNPTVMLLGDSHAYTIRMGLGQELLKQGEILLARTAGEGCPLIGMRCVGPTADSLATVNQAQDDFERMFAMLSTPEGKQVKTVVLMAFWYMDLNMNDRFFAPAELLPLNYAEYPVPRQRELIRQGLRRTLAFLTSRGIRVVFCLDNPRVQDGALGSVKPPMYLPRRFLQAPHLPYLQRKYHDADVAQYMGELKPVLDEFPQVQIFDPTPLFCDEERMYMIRDGRLFFIDDNHLSVDGGAMFAQELARQYFPAKH